MLSHDKIIVFEGDSLRGDTQKKPASKRPRIPSSYAFIQFQVKAIVSLRIGKIKTTITVSSECPHTRTM